MAITLKPHQEKAVKELDNGRILVGDVGTGKSLTAASYAVTREAGRDIYVITTAKKRESGDWVKEFAHFGIEFVSSGPRPDSGGVGGGEGARGVLRVDSWNNIGKYVGVEDAFFIFDEQRLVGTGAWTKAFYKIAKSNRWILLSATPGDTWLDYAPVFIANGWYKNITQFKEDHVVYAPYVKFPKVVRYNNPGKLVRLRNQILVEMPYLRHTTRKITWQHVDYREDLLEEVMKKRWNVLENKPLKDIAELFRVVRRVVNSDVTRLEAVRALMAVHPRLIVFYTFDYELEMLRGLLSTTQSEPHTESVEDGTASGMEFPDDQTSRPNRELLSLEESSRTYSDTDSLTSNGNGFSTEEKSDSIGESSGPGLWSNEPLYPDTQIAEWNGHKHEPVPTGERWVYLVQYTAGHDGWNCTTTDAMVFWSLPYSHRMFYQSFGRIDRMNTPYSTLYYYVLFSKSWIDLAIRKALMAKKNFHESSFAAKI